MRSPIDGQTFSVQVTAPDGRRWTVRRRWLPRYDGRGLRERLRDHRARRQRQRQHGEGHWWDWFDPFWLVPDESITALVIGVLIMGLITFTIFVGLPILLALVDAVVVLFAAVGGLAARVLLRRPWTVEATASSEERHVRQVVGWRAAGRAARSWAEELRLGHRPS